ncbi:MAG: FKBP-type peptidyl-prolyl cis-trans isomerase [Rhodospirillales bacterium]|jgi:peptidylprolyl isomerase
MSQAKAGDTVRFHFTGTLTDGTTFASTVGEDPMSITLGQDEILPDVDAALCTMSPGDTQTVNIAAADAYGPHEPELIHPVDRNKFPPEIDLQPGLALEAATPEGEPLMIIIVEVAEDTVTVDENHPLAGHDLKFDIELLDIA